jgi:hypothetical protein
MRITYFGTEDRRAIVELSRRNLEVLLAKLDEVAVGGTSACTIVRVDSPGGVTIRAVENEKHYDEDNLPGPMRVGGEII